MPHIYPSLLRFICSNVRWTFGFFFKKQHKKVFVSSDNVVSLTSVHPSRKTTLRLTLLQGTTLAHKGLASFGLSFGILKSLLYIYHSRHTQSIKIIAEIVVNMNIVARIKISSKLKKSSSAIGYYSYTNRCLQS